MREADDDAFRRSRVYIDTWGALKESGDLIEPIRSGALMAERIAGDLTGLCGGTAAGRATEQEITLFKATGTALADLAAATLAGACAEKPAPPAPGAPATEWQRAGDRVIPNPPGLIAGHGRLPRHRDRGRMAGSRCNLSPVGITHLLHRSPCASRRRWNGLGKALRRDRKGVCGPV